MAENGISTNRNNIELPAEVSGEILQKAQEQSVVMSLARKIALPGRGAEIPVILSDPVPEWVSETGSKPVSNPNITKKVMTAYKLAAIVPFSNEFKRDAESLYNALVSRLPLALGRVFDETVFHGDAPGSNFDTFKEATTKPVSYDGFVEAIKDVASHDGIANGIALSPQGTAEVLSLKDGNGRPLFINSAAEGAVPLILGVPAIQSKGAYKTGSPEALGVIGDWTQAMFGIVDDINIGLSEDATLTTGGGETINLFQQNMFAVRVEMEVGFRADTSVFVKLVKGAS